MPEGWWLHYTSLLLNLDWYPVCQSVVSHVLRQKDHKEHYDGKKHKENSGGKEHKVHKEHNEHNKRKDKKEAPTLWMMLEPNLWNIMNDVVLCWMMLDLCYNYPCLNGVCMMMVLACKTEVFF